MGWWIAGGILLALLLLPLGISVEYGKKGLRLRAGLGPISLPVYPRKKKPPKKKSPGEKPEKKTEKQKKSPEKSEDTEKKGGSLQAIRPLLGVAMEFLGALRRRLRVTHLELELTMAGDDPCDLAVSYGAANGAMAALLAQLHQLFDIRHQKVSLNCDFLAAEMTVYARTDIRITLGRLLGLLLRYGVRAVNLYLKQSKKGKGGGDL